jgi:hypothetical protein
VLDVRVVFVNVLGARVNLNALKVREHLLVFLDHEIEFVVNIVGVQVIILTIRGHVIVFLNVVTISFLLDRRWSLSACWWCGDLMRAWVFREMRSRWSLWEAFWILIA